VRWYKEDDRIIRAVDPRNLFRMMDATLDEGERLAENMDMNLFRRIYENYPAAFKKDAKFFVAPWTADPQYGLQHLSKYLPAAWSAGFEHEERKYLMQVLALLAD
jgi:hypothetical protein